MTTKCLDELLYSYDSNYSSVLYLQFMSDFYNFCVTKLILSGRISCVMFICLHTHKSMLPWALNYVCFLLKNDRELKKIILLILWLFFPIVSLFFLLLNTYKWIYWFCTFLILANLLYGRYSTKNLSFAIVDLGLFPNAAAKFGISLGGKW